MVSDATHGTKTLDLFITNKPNEVFCSVVQSSMHTDHRALHINSLNCNSVAIHARRTISFYDIRRPNIDALALEMRDYDWNDVLQTTDIDAAYERFLSAIDDLINQNIPRIASQYEITPLPTSLHL